MTSPVELKRAEENPMDIWATVNDLQFFDWDVAVIGTCANKVNAVLKDNKVKACTQSPVEKDSGRLNIGQALYNIRNSKALIICCEPDPNTLWQLGLAFGLSVPDTLIHDTRELPDEGDRHFPVLMRDRIPIIGYSHDIPADKDHIVHKSAHVHFSDFDQLEDFIARYESILRKCSRPEIISVLEQDFKKRGS